PKTNRAENAIWKIPKGFTARDLRVASAGGGERRRFQFGREREHRIKGALNNQNQTTQHNNLKPHFKRRISSDLCHQFQHLRSVRSINMKLIQLRQILKRLGMRKPCINNSSSVICDVNVKFLPIRRTNRQTNIWINVISFSHSCFKVSVAVRACYRRRIE